MHDRYVVKGRYRGKSEQLDSFATFDEAVKMASEYRMAFGREWEVTVVDTLQLRQTQQVGEA